MSVIHQIDGGSSSPPGSDKGDRKQPRRQFSRSQKVILAAVVFTIPDSNGNNCNDIHEQQNDGNGSSWHNG